MNKHILVIFAALAVVVATPVYDMSYHTSYHTQPYPLHHAALVQKVPQVMSMHGMYSVPIGHAVHPIPIVQQPQFVQQPVLGLRDKHSKVLGLKQQKERSGQRLAVFFAFLAIAHAGVIAPVVPAHPVVAHHVVAPVHTVSHTAVVHPAPLVHARVVHAPVVHAAPVVPVVRHAPLIAVHHH
ncbi:hypothetical protein HW555_008942 [Spodoptera exigua]|uniref:Uncharacterized protein n=1 Tax=Spodoptera exigua TaxID=7107 RepID=A0A835GA79_SPOEX|nr:hypothetical protein HW555_008942 [Spodoptera exigua]